MSEWIPTLDQAIDAYLEDLYLEGRSPATVTTYRSMLRHLRSDASVVTLDATLIRAQVARHIRAGHAMATALTCYGACASFTTFCRRWVTVDMSAVPRPRVPETPGEYLSKAQLRALRDAALTSRRRPAESLLILLLLMQGLRAAELCSLRWQDVREDRLLVMGKGRKQRAIALDDTTRALLCERSKVGPLVFAMSTAALRDRLSRLSRRAGVPGVHPHLLRSSWASWWIIETQDMETMRVLGGWSATSRMPAHYARAALTESALRKARAVDLSARLLESPHEAHGGAGGE